ncbi:heterogeneous nuclear ribonucleoprotein D-like-B [Halichondria panicea]|uniref:heterogeneous nuclear ribonucleoprotein D-like-B n=1 Tax=Halichondria panicea TaxID=6063 RepID=UPI00312B8AE3
MSEETAVTVIQTENGGPEDTQELMDQQQPPLVEDTHPEVASDEASVQEQSIEGTDSRKLFVGGLSRKSSSESLTTYFSQFGEVEDVDLKKDAYDPTMHRGFCFVIMKTRESALKILDKSDHFIDDKTVECKQALPHEDYQAKKNRTKKVFVGGVPTDMEKNTIDEYFAQFGEIEEVAVVTDKDNPQKRRGFVFVTFKEFESVDQCTKKSFHSIDNSQVEVKRATPREDSGPFRGGGRGMRGTPRGRGGWQPYGGAYGGYSEEYYGGGGGGDYYHGDYSGRGYGYGGGSYGGGRGGYGGASRYGPMKGSYGPGGGGGGPRGYHPYGR